MDFDEFVASCIDAADVPVGVLAPPHDHRMWAVVGAGEVIVLPTEVVHTIANEGPDVLHAVHVYGGDLIGTVRSVWDRTTGVEHALDWDALRGRNPGGGS